MRLSRSLLCALAPVLFAPAARAQGRVVDEGTFVITRAGVPAQTESFRIRVDGATIVATGQLNAGTRRVSSSLTTDSLGTPMEYRLDVRENGAPTMSLSAMARGGRLTTRAQLARGDESTREYPVAAGGCVILDDDLLHQSYFLALNKRAGAVQVINPHSARGWAGSLTARGLESVTIGGKTVTATHYSLANGAGARDFWVDDKGRLLQIEIPASGLKAVREELPRP